MSTLEQETITEAVRARARQKKPYQQRVNVGDLERVVSGVLGGLMALGAVTSLGRRKPLRALLMMALGGDMLFRATTGFSLLYKALGVTGSDATFSSNPLSREIHVSESVTILKPAGELYAFWRDFRNLPRVMSYLERVDIIDGTHSHWVAKGPADYPVEWDAEVVLDEPGEVIAWRSVEGSEVSTRGRVRFEPAAADRGTVVMVDLTYKPPAGALGAVVATLTGRSPSKEIREDLRQFKQNMETGETSTIAGQSRCSCWHV